MLHGGRFHTLIVIAFFAGVPKKKVKRALAHLNKLLLYYYLPALLLLLKYFEILRSVSCEKLLFFFFLLFIIPRATLFVHVKHISLLFHR